MSTTDALLLVGHGTRSASGTAEFLQTAQLVASRFVTTPVQPCFLELNKPSIAEGLARLVEQGARRVVVVPLVLFSAGHAKRDIPAAVAEAARRWPELSVVQTPHLGCQEEILELSVQRYRETFGGLAESELRETALVLVGRGSYDAEATAEMHRFTQLRAARAPVGKAVACFLAMAEPRLERVLSETASQGWRRIVVQPHLLFQGELLDHVQSAVAVARERWPDREWLVALHLGPAPLLVEAIVVRYQGIRSRK